MERGMSIRKASTLAIVHPWRLIVKIRNLALKSRKICEAEHGF
jgi:hypothetical protein